MYLAAVLAYLFTLISDDVIHCQAAIMSYDIPIYSSKGVR
jgi:hypothetical protein